MSGLIRANGCWTWFNDPRGYYSSTYSAIYMGAVTTAGDMDAYKYDIVEQSLQRFRLHSTLEVDDHDVPSLLVLNAAGSNPGKVLACYSKHTGQSYAILSSSAGDIRAWGGEVTIGTPESYVQLYQTGDTARTIYWFFRDGAVAGSYNWSFRTSTDGAATWATKVALLDATTLGNGYIRSFQNGASRIDFLVTRVIPAGAGANDLYHFYMTVAADGTRAFFKTDGTSLGGDAALPLDTADLTTVLATTNSWVWDGNAYGSDLYGVFAIFSGGATNPVHEYYRCKWNGSAWSTEKITDGGTTAAEDWLYATQISYSGGVALDPSDPDTVYLSSEYAAGDFRMEKWQRIAAVWTKTSDVTGAATKNARPIFVRGSGATPRCLFWGGTYTSFTSYSTSLYADPALTLVGPAKPASPTWRTATAPHASAFQAYYLLHEGTGTTFQDLVNARNGVAVSTPTWGSGAYGAELSGFTTGVYVTMDALAAEFQAGTLPRWVAVLFKNTDAVNYSWMFSFGRSSSANPMFGVGINLNGTANRLFGFARDDATTEASFGSTTAVSSDGAYHVVMMLETATNARALYLDGVSVVTNATNLGTATLNQASLGVLRRTTVTLPFGGTIGAVVVGWNGNPNPYLLYDDLINGQFAGTRAAASIPHVFSSQADAGLLSLSGGVR